MSLVTASAYVLLRQAWAALVVQHRSTVTEQPGECEQSAAECNARPSVTEVGRGGRGPIARIGPEHRLVGRYNVGRRIEMSGEEALAAPPPGAPADWPQAMTRIELEVVHDGAQPGGSSACEKGAL